MSEYSMNEIIELAVQIERSGYKFYDTALQRKDLSSKATKLLLSLRDDEINHEKTFKKLRNSENFDKLGDPDSWQVAASYLKTISDSHIFSKPDAAIKLASNASDELEIVNQAIQFEKDTLLFFHSIQHKTKDEKTKTVLKVIIDEEVSHVMKLQNIAEELS